MIWLGDGDGDGETDGDGEGVGPGSEQVFHPLPRQASVDFMTSLGLVPNKVTVDQLVDDSLLP